MSGRSQPTLGFTRHLPSACALALALACAVDACFVPGPRSLHFAFCCLGLALALGVVYGLLCEAAFFVIGLLPRALVWVTWPATLLVVATKIAWMLGAQTRLRGAYSGLALTVFATCATAALGFACLLCALQPTGSERRGLLPERSRGTRALWSFAIFVLATALALADRILYVDLYAVGHMALRLSALLLCTLAFALVHDWLRLPRMTRPALAAVAVWLVFVLLTLNEGHASTLQAFALRPWPALALGMARDLIDVDRDGYASWLGGGDCAPFDPRVHPGAREIPGNGIDDNCVLGDAQPKPTPSFKLTPPPMPVSLDIVLITVDSLRRDRVGLYASGPSATRRDLTPKLDRWAQDATVFRHAYSPGGWTSLALPALMRAVYPRRLRWTRFYETSTHRLLHAPLGSQLQPGETPTWLFAFPVDDAHQPLAESLAQRGMTTVAVVDDGRSEILRRGTGIERGFQQYIEVNPGLVAAHDDADTASLAIAALSRATPSRRLFLWVHFFGVHSPSERHEGTPHYGGSVADRYDHEIRYFDTEVARLLAAIDRRGRPTAVFLTADHGEELEPTVRHHGYSVNEEVIAVPLIARVPGWPARSSEALVNLVDLMPTILTLTGTPVPPGLDGADLRGLIEGAPHRRILISDTWRFDVGQRLVADFVAAYDGRHKLVVDELGYGASLYDQNHPDLSPVLRFGVATDDLSKAAYHYLEDTGGPPMPSD